MEELEGARHLTGAPFFVLELDSRSNYIGRVFGNET